MCNEEKRRDSVRVTAVYYLIVLLLLLLVCIKNYLTTDWSFTRFYGSLVKVFI